MSSTIGTPIRTAVIGFGLSGRIFHAPFIAAAPAFELRAVVTTDGARRAAVREEYPDAELLDSAQDVFARADAFDLVVIATPGDSHEALASEALDAGLHVALDKPFVLTAAAGRALIAKAQDAGRCLTVFHNRRWDGDFRTVRSLIDAGELGEITRFESRFEKFEPTPGDAWRYSGRPVDGAGVLFDLGSHVIDQALQLFGPVDLDSAPDSMHVEIDRRRAGTSADDDVFLALHHTSGVRSHLWMSAVRPNPGPRFQVVGSTAGYTSWGIDGQEQALKDGLRPGDAGFGVTPPESWGTVSGENSGEAAPRTVETLDGDYVAFYRQLAVAIRGEGSVPVDPADAVAVLEIIERALAVGWSDEG
ncbi:Gfo/Idh/MocA family protein [Corynebacterium sp. AOP40-9SA-29]|uniref:Gfo/Idh/MocA family protein n=1 Tax=Corynebacterium sp. AOP40-9SA-29 TaxID=3457677 RepID=UPI004034BD36